MRFAGSTYGQWEYWPGPLDDTGEASADLCDAFDRVWVVTTADLAAYHKSGVAAADLAAWPVGAGAPFFVDADGDGRQSGAEPTVALRPGEAGYDPARAIDLAAGERPVVYGAQTAWWVMNDRGGEHQWSEAPPLGVEVRATAWTLADADRPSLYHSTFYRYEVLNRSEHAVDETFVGLHIEGDLGDFNDDYVHSDSTRSMLVFYNGDEYDSGYGVPPAVGIDLLSGGYGAMIFAPSNGVTGDPINGIEAYNFLQARFKNGVPLKVGGDGYNTNGDPTRWIFSGDPTTESFWTEEDFDGEGRSSTPGDRRAMISAEFGRLAPGEEATLDVGILFAQGGHRLGSVRRLRDVSDAAQEAYESGDLFRAVTATGPPPPPSPPSTAPTLLRPAEGASFDEGPVTFEWTAVPDATGYRVEFSATPDFTDPILSLGATTSRELGEHFLPPNRTEPSYWRVVPLALNVAGTPSEARQISLYRHAPGPLTYGDGEYAFVEVVGPGGLDPCGPDAASTDGCDEVGGNAIYGSLNSTADYVGSYYRDGPEASIGAFAPNDYEIRFTEEGSYAFYGFTTGRITEVPFEVWDIGVVPPGVENDPTDDCLLYTSDAADE